MHHYVSLKSQGASDTPWGSEFGEPSLVLSAEAGVYTFTHTGKSYGGWGYVCPELEDTEPSFHGVIEYCLQEWRSANNASEWKRERKGECGGANTAMVNTYFSPGTLYATEMSGSQNTFEVGSANSGHYEAKITKTNLIKAAQLLNAQCAGWHLSENPEKYALVGVEQGLEGWSGVSVMGGWGANLQLRTEYTPLPPIVTTEAATGVQETQATLNGAVNPRGTDAKYHFEYGTSTGYGTSTPEGEAGSGGNPVLEHAGISNLVPGMTYHYRIVASSSAGSGYGADRIFTTTDEERSSGWALRDPTNGNQAVYLRGKDGALWSDVFEQSTGKWAPSVRGGNVAVGTTPVVIRDPTNGNQAVFFQGSDGALWRDVFEQNTGLWTLSSLGGHMAAGASPTALRDPTNGNQAIFVPNNEGVLWRDVYEQANGSWAWSSLGGKMAPGTSATALRDPTNGNQAIFVPNNEGVLWRDVYEPSNGSWAWSSLGGKMASGASPTVIRDPTNGNQEVFFKGSDNTLWHNVYEQSTGKWTPSSLGVEMG